MSTSTKLLALLTAMGRINPELFAVASAPPGHCLGCDLDVEPLQEKDLRACAERNPELTAGAVAVHQLAAAAHAAAADGRIPQEVLQVAVEEWCSGSRRAPIAWPRDLPVPNWVRQCHDEPWRDQDMFYSAAAVMAGLAQRIEDAPTRAAVQQLSERLLARAELPRAA